MCTFKKQLLNFLVNMYLMSDNEKGNFISQHSSYCIDIIIFNVKIY